MARVVPLNAIFRGKKPLNYGEGSVSVTSLPISPLNAIPTYSVCKATFLLLLQTLSQAPVFPGEFFAVKALCFSSVIAVGPVERGNGTVQE